LGIIAKNREEWAISALACLRQSITIVPFFESLGAQVIGYIMMQTQMETVCCDGKKFEILVRLKQEGKAIKLKNIIVFDEVT
jgi:long-subunit acyl-CoA synthetase (AMP-forming)